MPDAFPAPRRRALQGLPAKAFLFVLAMAAAQLAVMAWVSVDGAREIVGSALQDRFPELADRTARRVDGWLAASRRALLRTADAGARSRRHPEPWLASALAGSPFFDALWLTDAHGALRAAAGAEAPGSDLSALVGSDGALRPAAAGGGPVAAVALRNAAGRTSGWLLGRLRTAPLRDLLDVDALPAVGSGHLVDGRGHVLASGGAQPDADPADLPMERLRDTSGVVVLAGGWAPRLARVHPLEGVDGAMVVVVADVGAGLRRVLWNLGGLFLVDLALVLVCAWLAFRFTARIVRPLGQLCEGAEEIASGTLDVEIPDAGRADEIGELTRRFNTMSRKLHDDQREIHSAQRLLRDQNQALQGANEILAQLSITDGLTKLHNHRFFQDHLTREIKRANRSGEPLAMLLVDIDDFKKLNDRHGHAAGDAVLLKIARVLTAAVRESDLLARYGGEEFAVVAANTDLPGGVALAEKLRMAVEETSLFLDDNLSLAQVTVSIGVACYRGDRRGFFRDADRMLYAAKAAGKNCVMVEQPDF